MPNSWKFPLRPQGTDPPTNRPPQGVTGGRWHRTRQHHHRPTTRTSPNNQNKIIYGTKLLYRVIFIIIFAYLDKVFSGFEPTFYVCLGTHIPHRSCRRTKLTERATDRTRQPGGPINISWILFQDCAALKVCHSSSRSRTSRNPTIPACPSAGDIIVQYLPMPTLALSQLSLVQGIRTKSF